jgi:hypothetical protein
LRIASVARSGPAVGGLFLPDQQRLFDGALVDLIQHGVGGLAVQRPIAVGEFAL